MHMRAHGQQHATHTANGTPPPQHTLFARPPARHRLLLAPDPSFVKRFRVLYCFEKVQTFKVLVVDIDKGEVPEKVDVTKCVSACPPLPLPPPTWALSTGGRRPSRGWSSHPPPPLWPHEGGRPNTRGVITDMVQALPPESLACARW